MRSKEDRKAAQLPENQCSRNFGGIVDLVHLVVKPGVEDQFLKGHEHDVVQRSAGLEDVIAVLDALDIAASRQCHAVFTDLDTPNADGNQKVLRITMEGILNYVIFDINKNLCYIAPQFL